MLCYEGRLSLLCFLSSVGILLALFFSKFWFDILISNATTLWSAFIYYALLNIVLRYVLKENNYQIGLRAAFLGFIFALSLLITLNEEKVWRSFGIYGIYMSLFHYSEYLAIAWCNPKSLSIESFILNHSVHYALAAAASWVEFFVEAIFFPWLKEYSVMWIVGAALCTGGEILRKLAMITARSNFNHIVEFIKRRDHELITHGIYRIMRHPSYVGWFLWSIGTQVILCNPICIVAYSVASWKFFKDRIYIEEITLLNFFGEDYYNYQQQVPTGLPFIKGYQVTQ